MKIFAVKFSIETPLHIGYHKINYLQRTRYYVPGKNFWGALTAKLTPILKTNPSDKDYQQIGDFLKKNVVFSYHYLENSEGEKFQPNFVRGKGLCYGKYTLNDFEKRFVSSLTSTAIETTSMSAEKGTLHEIELIINKEKDSLQQLFLSGYLFIKEGETKNYFSLKASDKEVKINSSDKELFIINEALTAGLAIGGERRYGYGKIRLSEIKFCQNQFTTKDNTVYIDMDKNTPIKAHLKIAKELILNGEIEAINGKEWGEKGAGRKITDKILAWVPGSILKEKSKFKISDFGTWEIPITPP